MISALVVSSQDPAGPPLVADLESAGIHALGAVACDKLVQEALREAPDVVVCWEPRPGDDFFRATTMLMETSARPVAVFTSDGAVETAERALRSGVHEWVVQGYARERLRPVLHTAIARFRREHEQRNAFEDLSRRFEERKLIDRAKGLLMRASQITEDEAFKTLRSASMAGKRRVGQVSQQVIEAARDAEAINRAGQLRMLSQRAVKLYVLAAIGPEQAGARALLAVTLERAEANLGVLDQLLSKPTWGDLVGALRDTWFALHGVLGADVELQSVAALDGKAEQCLVRADRLVEGLELAGLAPTLHVVNLSGRQRMLSQRVAKHALLAVAEGRTERVDPAAVAEFERSLDSLRDVPLTTRDIREDLDHSRHFWEAMLRGVARADAVEGRRELAAASEALLDVLDRLTDRYEHSMQLLIS